MKNESETDQSDHFTIHKNGIIDPCCGMMKGLSERGCIDMIYTVPEGSHELLPHPGLRFLKLDSNDLAESIREFNGITCTGKRSDEYVCELREHLEDHISTILFTQCPFCKAKMIRSND